MICYLLLPYGVVLRHAGSAIPRFSVVIDEDGTDELGNAGIAKAHEERGFER